MKLTKGFNKGYETKKLIKGKKFPKNPKISGPDTLLKEALSVLAKLAFSEQVRNVKRASAKTQCAPITRYVLR